MDDDKLKLLYVIYNYLCIPIIGYKQFFIFLNNSGEFDQLDIIEELKKVDTKNIFHNWQNNIWNNEYNEYLELFKKENSDQIYNEYYKLLYTFKTLDLCNFTENRVNTNTKFKNFFQEIYTIGSVEQFYENYIENVNINHYIHSTFNYIFKIMKKGIFVQIKDGVMSVFIGINNAHYINDWGYLVRKINKNIVDIEKKKFNWSETNYSNAIKDKKYKTMINNNISKWYANNYMFRNTVYEYDELANLVDEGNKSVFNFLNYLSNLIISEKINNVSFFINPRDHPVLKKNRNHPYEVLYTGGKVPQYSGVYDLSGIVPIFSQSTTSEFDDELFVTDDDVKFLLYPSEKPIDTPWENKKNVAIWRGSATGQGTTSQTNNRLKIIDISLTNPELVDAKLTGSNYRLKLDQNGNMTYNESYKGDKRHFVSFNNQTMYKYIIHIEGHVAAFRLLKELTLHSVILKVDSEWETWYSKFLIGKTIYELDLDTNAHYIRVKKDMSDIISVINWCIANDNICKRIADNSYSLYMNKFVNSNFANTYFANKLNEISERQKRANKQVINFYVNTTNLTGKDINTIIFNNYADYYILSNQPYNLPYPIIPVIDENYICINRYDYYYVNGLPNSSTNMYDLYHRLKSYEMDMINNKNITFIYFQQTEIISDGINNIQKPFENLRNFHNYIKDKQYKNENLKTILATSKLLDISVGKGGDIMKWKKNKISEVYGIDPDNNSIIEAKRRFNDLRLQENYTFSNETFLDIYTKLKMYDITSCQFTMHYFKPEEYTKFANAISSVTKQYFLLTTMEETKLKKFDTTKYSDYYELIIMENGFRIRYKEDTMYNKDQEEYYVNMERLKTVLMYYDLFIVDSSSFEDEYYNSNFIMNDYERALSFTNEQYIFKKITFDYLNFFENLNIKNVISFENTYNLKKIKKINTTVYSFNPQNYKQAVNKFPEESEEYLCSKTENVAECGIIHYAKNIVEYLLIVKFLLDKNVEYLVLFLHNKDSYKLKNYLRVYQVISETSNVVIYKLTSQTEKEIERLGLIIIPFREDFTNSRTNQLKTLLNHISNFDYLVVVQGDQELEDITYINTEWDHNKFNRGRLLNEGVAEYYDEYDYFIFHDVDLIPDEKLLEEYLKYPKLPIHLGHRGQRYSGKNFIGGVFSINKEHLTKINGFPNNFYGWGGEDDAMYNRLMINNIHIEIPEEGSVRDLENITVTEKLMNLDQNNQQNNEKEKLLNEDKLTWRINGLNNYL